MGEVLRASVELPTIIFTAILAVAAGMWLLSLLGVVDVDGADGAIDGALDGVLEPLHLSEIPATVLLTLVGISGWFVSVLASVFLLDGRSGGAFVALAVVVGVVAAGASLAVTSWVGPKIAQAFETERAPSKRDLIGRVVEIRSATVTDTIGRGEATWPDGTVSTVDLRVIQGSDVAPGELRRGDRALLVDWDESSDDFIIGHVPPELTELAE